MENDRIANAVYAGECAGICSMGRSRKKWTDTVKECLRKRDLDFNKTKENGAGKE